MMKKILMLLLVAAPLSLAAQKFAHFNYADVMQALPAYKAAQTELENMGKKYQADLADMEKEIQTKYEKYQTEVNDSTPANIRQRKEQEIMDLRQRYEQAVQDNSQAFQQAQQTKMQPVIQKVVEAVNTVAREGGYVYIIDKQASQAAGIFFNETLSEDVTKKVMAKLGITAGTAASPTATK